MPVVGLMRKRSGKELLVADKLGYLTEQGTEIARLLAEPIEPARLPAFVRFDAQKYLFIRKGALELTLQNGDQSTITRDLRELFSGLDKPAKEDTYDFHQGRPMSLFNILRLNECFSSNKLDGSDVSDVLRGSRIRGGLPDGSVVPSTRAIDRRAFRREFIEDSSGRFAKKKLVAAIPHPQGRAEHLVQALADTKSGNIYVTVTKATALLLTDAINALSSVKARALDDLFPLVPDDQLSTKRSPGYRPLELMDGNII